MASKRQDRPYDVVLLGATGYTGALTAEHIVQYLPTNLRWAIAGRSREKLETLAARLRRLEPDRVHPTIEIVSLDRQDQLDDVLSKAKICISVVSYSRVGTQVVEASIKNGTDYVDTAGNVPLFGEWFSKYHEKAKGAGVTLIHGCGTFSAPQDILTWLSVRQLKRQTRFATREVILAVREITLSPSGGTAASMLHKSSFDAKTIKDSYDPWYLSPVGGGTTENPINSLGIRYDPSLGVLVATSFGARQDRAIVHRTWGLLRGGEHGYGPNFHFNEYDGASSTLHALWKLSGAMLLGLFLSFKPAARWFFPKEGDGPDLEVTKSELFEVEALAIADGDDTKRALSRFKFIGGSYRATAAVLSQAAASLLYSRELEGGHEGGCLTPAILGEDFVERLKSAGVEIDTRII